MKQTPLTREEIALEEVGHTDIAPWLSRVLNGVFLLTIAAVGLIQVANDFGDWRRGDRATPWPRSTDVVRLPGLGFRTAKAAEGSPLERLFAGNREVLRGIERYETNLEERSVVGEFLRPGVQALLTERAGAGNEQTYCGRGGWLFLRAAVDHLTGHGVLEPAELRKRANSGSEWVKPPQPDPILAICQLREQLAAHDIELVVLPVPVKASIHPEFLSNRFDASSEAVHNPSYGLLTEALKEQGVIVFDPTDLLIESKKNSEQPLYLKTDTHWTPSAMDLVARELATQVRGWLGPMPDPIELVNHEILVSNSGDLATMLQLPESSPILEPQEVKLSPVATADGSPWRPEKGAEILVLGDSFTNIYSQPGLGWGAAAGVAERLSYHLGQPLDTIVRNSDGAYATRLLLSQDLAQGRNRLENTRLVIWEFSARELSQGDWRLLEMELDRPTGGDFLVPPQGTSIVVEATIAKLAPIPEPNEAPYADFIVGIHLVDITAETALDGDQAMVFAWAMRERRLVEGADYQIGQRVTIELKPWADIAGELSSVTRGELFDDNLLFQEPCWGQLVDQ